MIIAPNAAGPIFKPNFDLKRRWILRSLAAQTQASKAQWYLNRGMRTWTQTMASRRHTHLPIVSAILLCLYVLHIRKHVLCHKDVQ